VVKKGGQFLAAIFLETQFCLNEDAVTAPAAERLTGVSIRSKPSR